MLKAPVAWHNLYYEGGKFSTVKVGFSLIYGKKNIEN